MRIFFYLVFIFIFSGIPNNSFSIVADDDLHASENSQVTDSRSKLQKWKYDFNNWKDSCFNLDPDLKRKNTLKSTPTLKEILELPDVELVSDIKKTNVEPSDFIKMERDIPVVLDFNNDPIIIVYEPMKPNTKDNIEPGFWEYTNKWLKSVWKNCFRPNQSPTANQSPKHTQ